MLGIQMVTVFIFQVQVEDNGEKQPLNFRKLLVSRCQQEFERDYLQGLDKQKYEADLVEAGNDEAKKKVIQVFFYISRPQAEPRI